MAKTNHQRKEEGSYANHLHGNALEEITDAGLPIPLKELSPLQMQVWNIIVNNTAPEVLNQVDSMMLQGATRWYEKFQYWDDAPARMDTDPYKADCMASMCWKQFTAACAKFGLSPMDRAKIKLDPGQQGTKKKQSLEDLLKQEYDG